MVNQQLYRRDSCKSAAGWSERAGLTGVRAQVNGELAGVAAGVGADLAFEGPLVVVDPEVLLQAAAVRRCVQAVFAFVRLLTRV